VNTIGEWKCYVEIDKWNSLFDKNVCKFIKNLELEKDEFIIYDKIVFNIKKEKNTPSLEKIELLNKIDDLININNKLKLQYINLENENEMNKSMINGIVAFLEYGPN
jgi:DNA polymerase elongation subunit (family B)